MLYRAKVEGETQTSHTKAKRLHLYWTAQPETLSSVLQGVRKETKNTE
jgi:hypothetical protein